MTDNVPLIFDTQDNRIKELPVGNNLDLTGSGIVNAASLDVSGSLTSSSLTVNSITINSQSLSAVAFSNDYEDLVNTPTLFTGEYNDLTNKPNIPTLLNQLNDVDTEQPNEGDALIYDSLEGVYKPRSIINQTDLEQINIGDLNNVLITGVITDKFLKFKAGAWRPSRVQYAEVQNTPTAVSAFANDLGYLTQEDLESGIEITPTGDLTGSVFADDSTLLVDGVAATIPGTLTGNWNNPGNTFNISGDGTVVSTSDTGFIVNDSGINFANTTSGDTTSFAIGAGGFSLTTDNGFSMSIGDNISISASNNINLSCAGNFTLASDELIINNGLVVANSFDGDLSGSVFSDGSTLLVDGVNGTLPYTPSQSSDWAGDAPETVYEALDRIAAALTALGQQA